MHGLPLLIPLVLLLAGPAPEGASPPELSQRGKELMAAGRYAEAVPVYHRLVEVVPDNPGLILNLGMALHLAGQDEEAIPRFEAVLKLQPTSLPAALFLGAAHLRQGRPEAAVAPLQKAVKLQPTHPDARSMLAEAFLGSERYTEAVPQLRKLTELSPKDSAAWFSLGKTYEELAGEAFESLMKQEPEGARGLALRAESLLAQGKRAAAFHLFREAIASPPTLRGLHTAVAAIYRDSGHAEWAAVEEKREGRLPAPDCAREPLACAFSAGRHSEVVRLASAGRTADAHYWRVRAYNELATRAFARLRTLPPSRELFEWTAERHEGQGQFAEAAEQWRKAIARAPEDPRLRLALAVALRQARDLAGARQALEELLQRDADLPEANYLLGDVLLAEQKPERALPLLERALRADPEQPHTHGALGRTYALLGRSADAATHLKQALPADVDGSLRYQLARALQATGREEEAQQALRDYEQFKKSLPAAEPVSPAEITPP
jgi:tetratricopeptide (TPR) repeat protein